MVRRVGLLSALLAGWIVWAAGAGQLAGSSVSTAPSTASTGPAVSGLKELRTDFFRRLLGGKFKEALDLLAPASPLAGDRDAVKARELTLEYLKVRAKADAERRAELAVSEARVRHARLAEKYRPRLVEQGLDAKLLEHSEAIAEAILAANRQLSGSFTPLSAEALKGVLDSIDRAGEKLSAARALVGEGQGEWGEAFRQAAGALEGALTGYRKAWEVASLPKDRPALGSASEQVQEALADLGVLVVSDPLSAALLHAREAKQLADDGAKFLQQDWVRQLVQEAEQRGQQSLRKGKWSDALGIYGHAGLSDLDPDSLAYQDQVKQIQQHVRVLNLYELGGAEPAALEPSGVDIGTTRPASSAPATGTTTTMDRAPRWPEMIAGIDARMVRDAISRIDYNYVDAPDYRKIGIAAMKAVKVLVETPEAAGTFPSLRDDAKRQAFLKGLETQVEQLAALPAVDHLCVKQALNRLLDLNDETLALPSEVVNMEFAEGMTGELDRFTSMIWPYEMEEFRKRTMGSFYGIGVQIRKDPGGPIEVVTPLPDTPAFRARVQAGDMILAVDGGRGYKDTRPMAIDQAVRLITGPLNTKVSLMIERRGVPKPFEVVIVRDEIHIQTVKGWRRQADGTWDYFLDPKERIAYVRITQFTGDTSREVHDALHDLRQAGARAVIVDLRFNPGGLLDSAVKVADEFLPHGLIVRTKGRNVREEQKSAEAAGEYQDGKVVVLVNQVSASAAEIVSGALKDWGRAVVVGERTYGKASVQRLIPLQPEKAQLKLTTAYYYLPSGKPLHRVNGTKEWGVDPDVPVPVTIRQTNRWAQIRQETDLLKTIDPDTLNQMLDQQLDDDLQLQTAMLLARLQLLGEPT